MGIAQHHGYPTPLLDWTESPFIAAFFAFSRLPKKVPLADHDIRIFAFNYLRWPVNSVRSILDVEMRFAALELRATLNPRVLPQQSIHMFSNVVDIERWISNVEISQNVPFLMRIDIPASDRASAMKDLRSMGITDASLFPGLDGICRSLAERWF